MLALTGCKRAPTNNFPPDDITVELTATNLPIVWIDVSGRTISQSQRVDARMIIIDNGKGQLNYADTRKHPGQHIDYEGHVALRYRGTSTFNDSPKKPYSFHTLDGSMKYGSKKSVKLLGMGKDYNWALIAPYSDRSMMRDLLAFELARPWMQYTPHGRYCEVFVDGIYYCPHHPDKGFEGERPEYKIDCDCRKPKAGLLFQAAKDWNIDLSQSYMIGDSDRDVEAGKNAGCKASILLTNHDLNNTINNIL